MYPYCKPKFNHGQSVRRVRSSLLFFKNCNLNKYFWVQSVTAEKTQWRCEKITSVFLQWNHYIRNDIKQNRYTLGLIQNWIGLLEIYYVYIKSVHQNYIIRDRCQWTVCVNYYNRYYINNFKSSIFNNFSKAVKCRVIWICTITKSLIFTFTIAGDS